MQKLYYSIKEVCDIIDEEQHILRYWEKEFSSLKPKKNRAGNRIYSEKDIEMLKRIKVLLRDDKLSVKQAKEQLHIFIFSELNNEIEHSGEVAVEEEILVPVSELESQSQVYYNVNSIDTNQINSTSKIIDNRQESIKQENINQDIQSPDIQNIDIQNKLSEFKEVNGNFVLFGDAVREPNNQDLEANANIAKNEILIPKKDIKEIYNFFTELLTYLRA